MEAKIARYANRGILLTTVLVAACLIAGTAKAQAGLQGKFTLPYETQWGQAVLPAGDYVLTFDDRTPTILIIRAKHGDIVAYEAATIRDDSNGEGSELLIGTRGERRIVRSLTLATVGETYVFERAAAHQKHVEEARVRILPVLTAQK